MSEDRREMAEFEVGQAYNCWFDGCLNGTCLNVSLFLYNSGYASSDFYGGLLLLVGSNVLALYLLYSKRKLLYKAFNIQRGKKRYEEPEEPQPNQL